MGMTLEDAGVIDLTPTWRDLIPFLVVAAASPEDTLGRATAMSELLKLADIVDRHIASLKELRDAPAPAAVCGDCGIRGAHAFGCPTGEIKQRNVWIACTGCGGIGDCTCDDVTCDKCESVNLPNCGEEGCPMPFGVDDDSIKAGEE